MLADVNGMWGGEEKLNSLRFETAVTQPFFMVCMQVNSARVNMFFQVPEEHMLVSCIKKVLLASSCRHYYRPSFPSGLDLGTDGNEVLSLR